MQSFFSSPDKIIEALGTIILISLLVGFTSNGVFEWLTIGLGVEGILAICAAPLSLWITHEYLGTVCLGITGVLSIGFAMLLAKIFLVPSPARAGASEAPQRGRSI